MRCRPGKSQRKITIGDGYCPPRPSTFVINGGQISLKQVGRAHSTLSSVGFLLYHAFSSEVVLGVRLGGKPWLVKRPTPKRSSSSRP